jgi:hypothetical protein
MDTDRSSTRPAAGRLVLAAAALAVLVLAGIGLATGLGGDEEDNQAQPRTGQTEVPQDADEPSTATFALPSSAPAARCAPPSAEGVLQLDAAFVGTVTAVSDGEVTLEPKQVWRGEEASEVVLSYDVAGAHRELLPVRFREGADYVVSVEDGVVRLCGYTAPASPELEQLFTAALG